MAKNAFLPALVLLLCFLAFSNALSKKSIETDQSALLAFKSHITVDSNSTHLLSNWTEGTSVCSWIGVGCSPLHHRVAALNVSNLGLLGAIPPHIGNLSFLTSIDISRNNFHGELPSEMAKLRRLRYIRFSVNNIGGEIPGWFGSLPNLHYLDLGNNSFSGSLPSSIFNATKLEFLRLPSNLLIGNIPEEIGNLKNLWYLNIQHNQIEGSLPLSFLNLSSIRLLGFTDNRLNGPLPLNICSKLANLERVAASKNQFSGQIQSRFKNCSQLRLLSLSSNHFTGLIPREIGNLTELVTFDCGHSHLQGEIPSELGNLRNLQILSIFETSVSGQIPTEIGNLKGLVELFFSLNNLSGPIPSSIFNLSSLTTISLSMNNLTGSLPRDLGLRLPNLEYLTLDTNRLTGVVPNSVSNLTKLTLLQLSENQFTGPFPTSLGNLRFLERLVMHDNFFTANSFGFLESLTSCRSLRAIIFGTNLIDIHLPRSIGNFSNSLSFMDLSDCKIKGSIPSQIGNLSGLLALNLGGNSLTGVPPPTIQRLSNLQYLNLMGNKISGFIPNYLCNMNQLTELHFENNEFYGQIPECFGNMTSLTYLFLNNNGLNSTLPAQIGNLNMLLFLDVHSNFLSGNIASSIGGLSAAIAIDLSDNKFFGNIPWSFGGLGNMINLSLSHNQLHGQIPNTFKNLLSIEQLDLSHNNLTGEIPATLEKLTALNYFNVSYNHFIGRVPSNGSFLNFTIDFFVSNDALCGGPPQLNFPLCSYPQKKGTRKKKYLRTVAYILIPVATLVFLMCAMLFAFLRRQKKPENISRVELASPFERLSYYEIQRATNNFNESNLLGKGSFGSVYKAVLRDGTILAIKVFNHQLERALRSFEIECEVISNIRHRNLLKVISSCSNLDFKALVLEYMPNGSLEKWLYSHNHFLDFLERLNIMVDVASALVYMHHGYSSPIVHCDLKPSNVLLDEEMIGHVSDFGISKLLAEDESMVQTMTLATIGYTAPEYGSEGLVSTRCDVYSFGILLMETFTRRKPTDEMFKEGWGLREMIMDGLLNSETKFIDQNLMNAEDKRSNKFVKCIVLIMKLALTCVMDSPEQRADMKDVLVELQKIKILFMSNSA